MARLVVTKLAEADLAGILAGVASEAGVGTAEKYCARFESFFDRLSVYPESYPTWPSLGSHIRVGVVFPYLVIYRHDAAEDMIGVLRILHGRRDITRDLLRA